MAPWPVCKEELIMPNYEYICDECGRNFEVSQSINDNPLSICPDCSGGLRRIISGGSGFILKGNTKDHPARTRCGKDQTCCGNAVPCESPHCGE
jgi:putative FmdB family regulatory protein